MAENSSNNNNSNNNTSNNNNTSSNNSTNNNNNSTNNNGSNIGATKQSLFREKSIERIESPEKLNDYLKVTSPGVWLVLGTIIIILAGVCIWGVFGSIEATSPAAIVAKDGESVCLVPEAAIAGVVKTRTAKMDGKNLTLEPSVLEPQVISETTDVYVRLAGNYSVGDIVYPVTVTDSLEEGVYSGTVVRETLSPASLFF